MACEKSNAGRMYWPIVGSLLQPGGIPDAETDIWTGYPHDNARRTKF